MFEVNEKILVVDDEKSIVDILKFNLQKEGFQVFTGSDGQEALEIFENCHPDLLILDVMMPRLSGYDVCRKIREKSMVPIIMLTARTELSSGWELSSALELFSATEDSSLELSSFELSAFEEL